MKIKFGFILVLTLILTCIFAFASCGNNGDTDSGEGEHTHSFGEWQTATAATCTSAGEEERACSCGEKETRATAATGHTYGEWNTVSSASCTEAGEEKRVCSLCQHSETRATEALGHNYGAWIDEVSATCTEDGVLGHYTCSACNKNFDASKTEISNLVIESQGHNYGAWIDEVSATCTEDGTLGHYTCSVCENNFDEDKNELTSLVIASQGHDYGSWIAEIGATCTSDGTLGHYTCSVCNKNFDESKAELSSLVIESQGHNYGAWIAEISATCTNDGTLGHYTCSVCNKNFDKDKNELTSLVITATGHDYGEWISEIAAECDTCGVLGHYHCSACNKNFDEDKNELSSLTITAPGHSMGAWGNNTATCTEEGEERRDCSVCDHFETRATNALGHSYGNWINEIGATCTENGTLGHYHCSVCNKDFDANKNELTSLTITAPGHSMGAWGGNTATCTEEGEERRDCSVCDYFETRATVAFGHNDNDKDHYCDECGANVGTHSDKANDGDHLCEYCNKSASDCNDSDKDHDCDECGATMGTHADSANDGNHNCDYCGEAITACNDADKDHYCDECGATMGTHSDKANDGDHLCEYCNKSASDCNDSDKDHDCDECGAIISLHNYGTFIEKIPATCTENGTLGHYNCSDCGKKFDINKSELSNLVIPAGHKYGTWIPEVSATCTENGTTGHYHCSVCNKDFDANKNELASIVISASHNYVNGVCTVCGDRFSVGLRYTLSADESYYIVSGVGDCQDNDIIIPSEYEGLPVKEIARFAFGENREITSVVLPDSITHVRYSAFGSCYSLVSVTLGKNLETVETDAFHACHKLVEVINHSSLPLIVDDYSANKYGLVAGYAKVIHEGASKIKRLGDYLFITLDSTNYLLAYAGNDNDLELPESYNGEDYEIYPYILLFNEKITSVLIPDTVTSIPENAFYACKNLTGVAIGDSVTSIGDYAFYGCSKLSSITIPKSVSFIGYQAFWGCTNLTNVTFENSDCWWYSSSADATSGTTISGLSNSATAATLLKSTYDDYYWKHHSIGEWIPEVPSNCTENGTLGHYTCSVCGKNFDEDKNELASLVIPVSHNYVNNVCSVCGDKIYTIRYENVKETNTNPETYTIRDADIVLNSLEARGYNFEGWYADSQFETKITTISTSDAKDITVYAKWTLIHYTITYVTNDGIANAKNPTSYTVEDDDIVFERSNKKDYEFRGWFTEPEFESEMTVLDTSLAKDITLYAKWFEQAPLFTYWVTSGEEAMITGYTGNYDRIYIPEAVDGYPVAGIDRAAFRGQTGFKYVYIPEGIRGIENSAFEGCVNIEIIDFYATAMSDFQPYNSVFKDAGVSKSLTVYVGTNVTRIPAYLFENCSNLGCLFFLYGSNGAGCKCESIGEGAFKNCVNLSHLIIPETVTEINDYAFYNCTRLNGLKFLTDSKLETIGAEAFNGCERLKTIEIPKNVTSIGDYAFANCFGITALTFETGSKLTSIGEFSFASLYKLYTITLPESLTSIGYCAFESCYRLVEVINNSSLNIIKGSEENGYAGYYAIEIHRGSSKILNSGDYIFYAYYTNNNWVYSLVDYVGESDTLVLPDNCNGSKYRINQYAFVFRDDIKSIRITENVGGIGTSAFYYCSNLEEFYFNAPSVSNLSYSVFSETGKDIKAVIGKNVIKLPPFLFYNSTVSSVEFEEGSICNSIGESSFKNCKKLTEIELPDTVSSIGASAFSGCVNLASINIPENVSAIEYQTFASCSSITELDLPSNITKIGVGAFAGCSSLVKVNLPDNLKTIGEQAFYNCTALKSVNIPEKVTKISYLAFGNCRALEEIYFAATALGDLNSGDYAFNYAGSKSNTLKVTVANNVTVIPKYLFYASYVKTVEFEEGSVCTAIKDYAFYGTKLTEIVIPDSVQKIGANAFYNCSTLSTVNYTGTKEQWNAITKGSSWDYNTGDYTVIYGYSK